jgi:hypothetical protein
MNDIQSIVDNFLAAAARLERLTGQINAMADQLEPALGHTAAEAAVLANPHVSNAIKKTFEGTAETVQVDWRAQTPQGAAPSSDVPPAPPVAAAVEVEGPGDAAPETPRPAVPTAEAPPWETQAAAAPVAEEKKGGRRTLEQIAADLGVNLDDVKRWKGAGKRVGKKDMEEFKALAEKAGNNVPAAPSNPFPPAPATAPYDNGGQLPTAAAPVTNQGPAQEWPASVAPQPQAPAAAAPGEQFGEWPTIEGGFDPSNPFGG